MRLEWSDAALTDLDNILSHQSKEIAANTAMRVRRAEQNIQLFPTAAHYDAETDTFERYIPKTRVILIYHIADDVIEMVSVFHTSRSEDKKRKQ